jgi:hypothetical protein
MGRSIDLLFKINVRAFLEPIDFRSVKSGDYKSFKKTRTCHT